MSTWAPWMCMCYWFFFFFFFQAEDGIRDVAVTGVQTCALPIFFSTAHRALAGAGLRRRIVVLLIFARRSRRTVELSRWESAGGLEGLRRRARVACGSLGGREGRCVSTEAKREATDAGN